MTEPSDLRDDTDPSVVVQLLSNADLDDLQTINTLVVPNFALLADKIIEASANSPNAHERSTALSLIKPLARILNNNMSHDDKRSLSSLDFSKYWNYIGRILSSKNPDWVEIWFFAMTLGKSPPKPNLTPVNNLLKHAEYAFTNLAKSSDLSVASQPYKAWELAADVLAPGNEAPDKIGKTVKLLLKPLLLYRSKMKIETWVKVIRTVGARCKEQVLEIVEPFVTEMVMRNPKKPNLPALCEGFPEECCQALVDLISFADLRHAYAHLLLNAFEGIASSPCSLNAMSKLCAAFEGFLLESKNLKMTIEYINVLMKSEKLKKEEFLNKFADKLDDFPFDASDLSRALDTEGNWRNHNNEGIKFLLNDSIGSKRWTGFCRAYTTWLFQSGNDAASDFELLGNALNSAMDKVLALSKEEQENVDAVLKLKGEDDSPKEGEFKAKLKAHLIFPIDIEGENKKKYRPGFKSNFQYRKLRAEEKNKLINETNNPRGLQVDEKKSTTKGSVNSSPAPLSNGPLCENKEKIVETDSVTKTASPLGEDIVIAVSENADEKENSAVLAAAAAMPRKVPTTSPSSDKRSKPVKKLTPSKCSYFEEDANDLVFIPPKTKTTPLTAHQIEKFSKPSSDIPALYQDLSQDMQTNSDSQQVIVAQVASSHTTEAEPSSTSLEPSKMDREQLGETLSPHTTISSQLSSSSLQTTPKSSTSERTASRNNSRLLSSAKKLFAVDGPTAEEGRQEDKDVCVAEGSPDARPIADVVDAEPQRASSPQQDTVALTVSSQLPDAEPTSKTLELAESSLHFKPPATSSPPPSHSSLTPTSPQPSSFHTTLLASEDDSRLLSTTDKQSNAEISAISEETLREKNVDVTSDSMNGQMVLDSEDSCDAPAKRTRRASTKLRQYMEDKLASRSSKRTQSTARASEKSAVARKRRFALLPVPTSPESASRKTCVDEAEETFENAELSEDSEKKPTKQKKSNDEGLEEESGSRRKRRSVNRGRGRASKQRTESPTNLEAWLKKPVPNSAEPMETNDVTPAAPSTIVGENEAKIDEEWSDDADIELIITSPRRRASGADREDTPVRQLSPVCELIDVEKSAELEGEEDQRAEEEDAEASNKAPEETARAYSGPSLSSPVPLRRRSKRSSTLPIASRSTRIMTLAAAKSVEGSTGDASQDSNGPTLTVKRRRNSIVPERLPETWPDGPVEEWNPCVPADFASPRRSLLKDLSTPSPASKKQVRFTDPPVSRGLLFIQNRQNGTGRLVQSEDSSKEKLNKCEVIPPENETEFIEDKENEAVTEAEPVNEDVELEGSVTRASNSSPELVVEKQSELVDKEPELVVREPELVDREPELVVREPELVEREPEVVVNKEKTQASTSESILTIDTWTQTEPVKSTLNEEYLEEMKSKAEGIQQAIHCAEHMAESLRKLHESVLLNIEAMERAHCKIREAEPLQRPFLDR